MNELPDFRSGKMNLTLAAYYGKKPPHFEDFIRWCQASVAKQLPGVFRPYDIDQVHATVVGLEGKRKEGTVLSENYAKLGKRRNMDFAGLLTLFEKTPRLPFRIRIGGYRISQEYPFNSRGQHPYLRSFAIQSSNIVVAMGWPEEDGEFPNTLDGLRRDFNEYNVIHKYHKIDKGFDNDLFFVIGKVNSVTTTNVEREAVSEIIRLQIAGIEPMHLDVTREVLSLVAYVNDELPLASSVQIPLDRAAEEIDRVIALYQEATYRDRTPHH